MTTSVVENLKDLGWQPLSVRSQSNVRTGILSYQVGSYCPKILVFNPKPGSNII